MKTSKALMYAFVVFVVLMEVGFVAAQMKRQMTHGAGHATLQAASSTSSTTASSPLTSAAAADEAAIRQVLVVQTTAWNTGNIDTFMQSYKNAPDTTFIGAKVRQGYQPILENYKKNYASTQKMGTLTFSELQVRVLDAKYAIVTGKFHLSRPVDKKDKSAKNDGVFSLVWEKTDDAGWKIILDHTS